MPENNTIEGIKACVFDAYGSLMSIQPLESIGIDWEISLIRFLICGVLSNWNTPGFAA
jgi:hypothetical protein